MNPLFISHLIADFLLQPTWLVKWKIKNKAGIFVHASIHIAVVALAVLPKEATVWAVLLGVGIFHGFIDHFKIKYQKKHTASQIIPFIIDQGAHLSVLVAASFAVRFPAWWLTEAGLGTTLLLAFFSFGFALLNVKNLKWALRLILLVITFALFLMPSARLVASACSSL